MSLTTPGAGEVSDGAATSAVRVVPAPVSVQPNPSATYVLAPGTAVRVTAGSADAREAGEFLAGLLRTPTGYLLPVEELPVPTGEDVGAAPEGGGIALVLDDVDGGTDPGSYTLDVDTDGVTLRAGEREGLFNGIATLRQLLPVRIDSPQQEPGPWPVPGGRIIDRPRFAYRGAHLDVARNFMPPAVVRRYIDSVARYKINHLHLHLTDDQGWRLEITSRPGLAEVGGASGVGGVTKGCYTQDEYRELVAYAWARGITVVPEIEGPNHAHAALASCPELNADGEAPPPHVGYGPSEQGLDVHSEQTYAFLDDVIGEVAALTPGPYLHIGGDETPGRKPEELSVYFRRVAEIVRKHGKQLIGWQEAAPYLEPSGTVTQYWASKENDDAGVAAAAAAGAKVLLSPSEHAYLDMRYSEDKPEYPHGNVWMSPTDLRAAYEWQPEDILDGLPLSAVHGIEACLWTETLYGVDQVENLAFPRLLAVAEVAWSPSGAKDFASFTDRVAAQGPRLRQAGVNYYRVPEVRWPFGS